MTLLLFSLWFLSLHVYAQLPDIQIWSFPSGTTVLDVATSSFDGDIYIVGIRNGKFIWTNFLNNSVVEANALSIDSASGDIYIGGIGLNRVNRATYYPIHIGKCSNSGDLIFMKSLFDIGGGDIKKLRTVKTDSKLYIVAGGSDSSLFSYLLITDQFGNLITTNAYYYPYVTTYTYGTGDGLAIGNNINEIYQSSTVFSQNVYTAVQFYNSSLNVNIRIYSPHDAQAIFISNDMIYTAGQTKQSLNGISYTSASQYDVIVSKYDLNGNLLQSKIFGGTGQDTPADMLVHPNTGDIFICGATFSISMANSFNHGSKDGFVAKLDSNMNLLWAQLFGWSLDDSFTTMSLHPNGRIYMIAQMNATTYGVSSYGVVSFNAEIGSSFIAPLSTSTSSAQNLAASSAQSSAQSSTVEFKADTTIIDNFIFTLVTTSSTKTISTQINDSGKFQSSFNIEFPSYFWPTIIGLCIGFPLIFIFILLRIYFNRQKERFLKKSADNMTSMTETATTTGTGFEYTSSSLTSSTLKTTSAINSTSIETTTQMVTQNAYSIPGFLQMNKGDIRLIKRISSGGQGTISIGEVLSLQFLQQYKTKQVIVKSVGLKYEQMSEREQNCFNQELAIIHYFREKSGFVKLFGYTLEPACLLLKYYLLGSMENLISRKGPFRNFISSKKFMISFLQEFAITIFLLHEVGFVHCDIKPQNILLEADQMGTLHPILTDFGITQIVSDKVLKVKAMTIENVRGFSICYGAPEQIQQLREKVYKPFSADIVKRRDIYAIGGIVYGLLMKQEPWHD